MCTFGARHAVGKLPLHYNTRKISLNLVCSVLFSHEALPKCRENYGGFIECNLRNIRRNIAKILVLLL